MPTDKLNTTLLTAAQFVAATLVVLIHSGQLSESSEVNFFLKNIICRLAVPLFMVTSSFFFRINQQKTGWESKVFYRSQLKVYFFWSLIYFPAGILYIWQQDFSIAIYPFALIFGVAYFGTWYHLWYIPALLFAIWLMDRLLTSWGYRKTFFFAVVLYVIGASETYLGYFNQTVIQKVFQLYANVFVTTRNGLFYACIFVLLGFLLADQCEARQLIKHGKIKLGISFAFLFLEGWVVFRNPGIDKNFLLMLIPVTYYLIPVLLYSQKKITISLRPLRNYSRYLFFIHPFILEMLKLIMAGLGQPKFEGVPLFIATFITTTVVSSVIIQWQQRQTIVRKS